MPRINKQACLVADAGMFAKSAPGLADLRLYRESTETPYVLLTAALTAPSEQQIAPLNLGRREGQTVFDVAMPSGSYSNLELAIKGRDFIATVTVSGSQAQGAGGETRLGSYTIFDLTRQKLGRSTVLHLPESDFPFLHLRIAGPIPPESVVGLSWSACRQASRSTSPLPRRGKLRKKVTRRTSSSPCRRARPLTALSFSRELAGQLQP